VGPVDWAQPWFAPWREVGEPVARLVAAGLPLHEALNARPGAPKWFTPHDQLPPGVPYERHVFESGSCPVREGLHDFFNGICWLGMPQAKHRLNLLQAAEIEAAGVGAVRGPVRDAITVFDENGALLQAPQALWDALLARQWRRLFVELRPLWGQARLLVFGHALLEKLLSPRKDLTAHVWRADAAMDSIAVCDAWLAGQLTREALAAKPFTPLPVLGTPGWWAANQNFSFYDDSLVFRARRPHLRRGEDPTFPSSEKSKP
jgi:hypothetical protein